MVIREYGKANPRHLLYFQGNCEPWTEFRESAKLLAERFHVMLVTPDGHDPAEYNNFISVEKTVDDAVAWLRALGIDHLDAVYGLSFGKGNFASREKYLPQIEVVSIPGMMHDEYVLMHPEAFARQALGFFEGQEGDAE